MADYNVVRADTGEVLGTMSSGYKPVPLVRPSASLGIDLSHGRRNTTCKHGVMTGPDIDGELCIDCATEDVNR